MSTLCRAAFQTAPGSKPENDRSTRGMRNGQNTMRNAIDCQEVLKDVRLRCGRVALSNQCKGEEKHTMGGLPMQRRGKSYNGGSRGTPFGLD